MNAVVFLHILALAHNLSILTLPETKGFFTLQLSRYDKDVNIFAKGYVLKFLA